MSKTEDEFYSEVYLISDDIVSHELTIRNIDLNKGPVVNRRKQLAKELFNEQTDDEKEFVNTLSPMNDLKICRSLIERYETEINDLTSTSTAKGKSQFRIYKKKNQPGKKYK